jgi:hypothetical protein
MDDASVVSVPAKESSPGDGHRPSPVADRASAEPMSARLARLLAHGFPH